MVGLVYLYQFLALLFFTQVVAAVTEAARGGAKVAVATVAVAVREVPEKGASVVPMALARVAEVAGAAVAAAAEWTPDPVPTVASVTAPAAAACLHAAVTTASASSMRPPRTAGGMRLQGAGESHTCVREGDKQREGRGVAG